MPPHVRRLIAIVIVVILVAVLVWFLVLQKSGTLVVTVQSSHPLTAVTYRIFLDGVLKDQGSLAALASAQYTFPLLWVLDACQNHQASADSTGGGLGQQSDSQVVSVCSGMTEHVTLTI